MSIDRSGSSPVQHIHSDPCSSTILLGMRERTRLIGGDLTIESGEQGTSIYLEATF